MNKVKKLDCFSVEDLLKSEQCLLILSNSHCSTCSTWKKTIEEAIANGTLPESIPYGILNINQKGLIPFRRENPWVEKAVLLPYTALCIQGECVDGFIGPHLDKLLALLSAE